jgi:hypothetical protein
MGAVGVSAGSAGAAEPANYGTCVTKGLNPSETTLFGPWNVQAVQSSGQRVGAARATTESGGASRFTNGVACG